MEPAGFSLRAIFERPASMKGPSAMPYQILTRDQHFTAPGPKRILALDGGGLRGILTLGLLQRLETV